VQDAINGGDTHLFIATTVRGFQGGGYQGSPIGSGDADYTIYSDHLHYTQPGYDLYARGLRYPVARAVYTSLTVGLDFCPVILSANRFSDPTIVSADIADPKTEACCCGGNHHNQPPRHDQFSPAFALRL
jgi:hypothetical protein